jgi:hypothetical protein
VLPKLVRKCPLRRYLNLQWVAWEKQELGEHSDLKLIIPNALDAPYAGFTVQTLPLHAKKMTHPR